VNDYSNDINQKQALSTKYSLDTIIKLTLTQSHSLCTPNIADTDSGGTDRNSKDNWLQGWKKPKLILLEKVFRFYVFRFLPRDASAERGDATVSCPSVRLSVCL